MFKTFVSLLSGHASYMIYKNQKTTTEITDLLLNFAALPAADDFSGKICVSCGWCLMEKKNIFDIKNFTIVFCWHEF